jgi:alpha-amylase/alpha-mannosidase (GH57 family)
MIYLGFLLHLYQPPNQLKRVLDRITLECYDPLLSLIDSRDNAKFTVNLNWSLTELLVNQGYDHLIKKIRRCLSTKKLEITGTAAYHAILPLVPKQRQISQINSNFEKNCDVLGKHYNPSGFFPPELAFGHEIVDSIRDCRYKWTMADDQSFCCIHNEVPWNYIPRMLDMPVLLRSSMWSNRIRRERYNKNRRLSGKEFVNWLIHELNDWWKDEDGYVIVALNGETFGHHIPGYIQHFLEQMLDTLEERSEEISMVHIGELLDLFPSKEKEVPPGSWSTEPDDFWSGNFYPLWKNKYNTAHGLLWELVELAIHSVRKLEENLDKSLNSCTFWWAANDHGQLTPITFTGIQMLVEIIKHAQPSNLNRALEMEEELNRVLSDKNNLGMLVDDEVLVKMDW